MPARKEAHLKSLVHPGVFIHTSHLRETVMLPDNAKDLISGCTNGSYNTRDRDNSDVWIGIDSLPPQIY